MDLSKKHKLMILFLSKDNQLLRRIHSFREGRRITSLKKEDVEEITGVSRQTPENWRMGKEMRKSTADGVFPHVVRYLDIAAQKADRAGKFDQQEFDELKSAVARFAEDFENEKLNVYEVAHLLGMSTVECQQTLDAAIYDPWPLLPAAYYPKAPQGKGEVDYAQAEADRYEGVYMLWVRRGSLWLQCPLRVRYLQKAGSGRFLRCKLNFPFIARDRDPDYGEYDGFLAIRENRLFWTFEKRQRELNDFFHFITDVHGAGGKKDMTFSGRYLTAGQDEEQSVVTDIVFLRRLFSDGRDRKHLHYRDIMWNEAKVLSTAEQIYESEQRWNETRLSNFTGGRTSDPDL